MGSNGPQGHETPGAGSLTSGIFEVEDEISSQFPDVLVVPGYTITRRGKQVCFCRQMTFSR